jgi:hypothetical protein
MNTKLIIGGVIAIAVAAMVGIGYFTTSDEAEPVGTYVDEDFVPTRPDVQAKPNTFSVLTPEEKAAEEAAERAAAEAALNASSSATTTATSTPEETDESE